MGRLSGKAWFRPTRGGSRFREFSVVDTTRRLPKKGKLRTLKNYQKDGGTNESLLYI